MVEEKRERRTDDPTFLTSTTIAWLTTLPSPASGSRGSYKSLYKADFHLSRPLSRLS